MKKQLLQSKVEAVSTNSLDRKLRIQVNGKWFVEDTDPLLIFGSPEVHVIKLDQ